MSRTLTVKQINNYIVGVFDDELILHDICVTGEIFEFKTSQNNTFIVLKEDDNTLECYRYGKLETFEKGAKVLIRGKIKFYPKSGRISLNILDIKLTGEGQYHLEFQKLKERLRSNGYFDNKTPLPSFVKRVALITSKDGAVLHDFLSVMQDGLGYIDIELWQASVQGDASRSEIINAIESINKKADVDVIVIARGGGSYQDLLPFNTEEIASAVFKSRIPIISAVGHETDYTLCDFCSSLRAPTPSLAAEAIAKINQAWLSRLYGLLARSHELILDKYRRSANHVTALSRKLASKNELALRSIDSRIKSSLRSLKSSLDKKLILKKAALQSKSVLLQTTMQRLYTKKERSFCELTARLDALSPLRLIAGGYAKVIQDGKTISCAALAQNDKEIKVVFSDGSIKAKIITKEINVKNNSHGNQHQK